MKIMVVDDSEINRNLLVWALEEDGYCFVEAENGQKAIDLFRSESPDLVLMDVFMPVLDGIDATKMIRSIPGSSLVPILFVSATVSDEVAQQCLEAGGNELIYKPIDAKKIQVKVAGYAANCGLA